MIAEAPPPPLHIPASPLSPGARLWTRWATSRQPDIPMGWPRDTAPGGCGQKCDVIGKTSKNQGSSQKKRKEKKGGGL